jgi:hypothetical protein
MSPWRLTPDTNCPHPQAPLPELQHLRCGASYAAPQLAVPGGLSGRMPLPAVSGVHLELAATFWPPGLAPRLGEGGGSCVEAAGVEAGLLAAGTARRCGFFLRSWRPGGEGAAAVVFDWQTRKLQVGCCRAGGWGWGSAGAAGE